MSNCTDYIVCTGTLEKIGYLGFIPMTCIIGVFFNIIILYIFTKSPFRSHMVPSMLIYLTGLAIADLHSSFLIAPIGFVRCIDPTSKDIQYFYNVYEKYLKNLGNIFTNAGIWITCAVTVERFIFILKNKSDLYGLNNQKSITSTLIILLAIFILASGCSVPLFLYYDGISSELPMQRSEFSKSVGYEVYAWIRLFIVKLIPMFVISILNVALIRNIKENNKQLKQLGFSTTVYVKRIRSQNRLTIMLLSISVVFILCHILEPLLETSIFTSVFGDCSLETSEYETLRMFGNWFESLTWISNFVSYCLFNHVFFRNLKKVLTRRKSRETTHKKMFKSSKYVINPKVSVFFFASSSMASALFCF